MTAAMDRMYDPPLTDNGIQQAKKTGAKLKSLIGQSNVHVSNIVVNSNSF
jgi:broad specificity phosphatase PhoE